MTEEIALFIGSMWSKNKSLEEIYGEATVRYPELMEKYKDQAELLVKDAYYLNPQHWGLKEVVMTTSLALEIKGLTLGRCSSRRISEKLSEKYRDTDFGFGNQMDGVYLKRDAAKILEEDDEDWDNMAWGKS